MDVVTPLFTMRIAISGVDDVSESTLKMTAHRGIFRRRVGDSGHLYNGMNRFP